MPMPSRKVRQFPISRRQLEILHRVAGDEPRVAVPAGDEPAFIEMWRNGLLRMNGEAGYQLSRLGVAALQAATAGAAQTPR